MKQEKLICNCQITLIRSLHISFFISLYIITFIFEEFYFSHFYLNKLSLTLYLILFTMTSIKHLLKIKTKILRFLSLIDVGDGDR